MAATVTILSFSQKPDDEQREALVRGGFNVRWLHLTDTKKNLEYLSQDPDLIVAEIPHPVFGVIFTEARARGIPIVAVANHPRVEEAVRCVRDGASDYIPQGDARALQEAVHRILEESGGIDLPRSLAHDRARWRGCDQAGGHHRHRRKR